MRENSHCEAIEFDPDGYLLFDDTVLSKPYAKDIEAVRRQWSGSEKRVIQGICLVTCVYVTPKTQQYWIIDYRIYDYDRDGKTKLQHLLEMLENAYFVKQLPFRTVLIDSWYVSMRVMKAIEAISKIYYAPLKCNRLVNDSEGFSLMCALMPSHGHPQNYDMANVCTSKSSPKGIK